MFARAFFIILVLCDVFLAYDIYSMSAARAAIAATPHGYMIAPENADLTMVEFLDYSCDECKNIDPVVMEALRRDGKVRYIPKPLPSGAEAGAKYVEVVYAAGLQGKFIEAHRELIQNFRVLDDGLKAEIARKSGMDFGKLKTDAKSDAVREKIDENEVLFRKFYIPSLPTFIIGNQIIFSPRAAPTVDDFLRIFAEARNGA